MWENQVESNFLLLVLFYHPRSGAHLLSAARLPFARDPLFHEPAGKRRQPHGTPQPTVGTCRLHLVSRAPARLSDPRGALRSPALWPRAARRDICPVRMCLTTRCVRAPDDLPQACGETAVCARDEAVHLRHAADPDAADAARPLQRRDEEDERVPQPPQAPLSRSPARAVPRKHCPCTLLHAPPPAVPPPAVPRAVLRRAWLDLYWRRLERVTACSWPLYGGKSGAVYA